MMAALAAAQAMLGIGQEVASGIQNNKAEQGFRKNRVPQAITDMADIATRGSSRTEIPGADIYRNQARTQIAQSVEDASRVAESPTDIFGTIRDMFANYSNFEQNLGAKAEDMRYQNESRRLDVLRQIGDYQSQEWMYNELYPYLQRKTAASQLGGAASANLNSALNAGLSIFGADWAMNNEQDMFDQWKKQILGSVNPAPAFVGYDPMSDANYYPKQ